MSIQKKQRRRNVLSVSVFFVVACECFGYSIICKYLREPVKVFL